MDQSREYKRSDRVADLLRQEISDILLRRVKDPRIEGVVITGVEVTDDLQHARIFYCVTGRPTEDEKKSVAAGLNNARGFMRQELGRRLHLRYLLQLGFHYDGSLEYGEKIERIIKELHKDERTE
jgi:ribosome-binding factor A